MGFERATNHVPRNYDNATLEGDMSPPQVAVAHYCEGAGHATRMLAVASHLEAAGYEVVLAGGGPGTKFIEANGYEEFEPTTVDFVEDYQRDGNLLDVLRYSGPAVAKRIAEYRRWLLDLDPDLLVADDLSAALSSALARQQYVYVSHDPAAFYSTVVERSAGWLRNLLARGTTAQFLLPKVWAGEPTIPGAAEIPPLAPETDRVKDDVDVLVVPSDFTVDPPELADELSSRGRSVTLVGGEEWSVERSLQPYIAGANLVVCSGYSTVMEAAVAGTPCIVVPETSEQRGVAAAITDQAGFYAATSVDAIGSLLDHIEPPESQSNGVGHVVDAVREIVPPGSTV